MKRLTFLYIPEPGATPIKFHGDVANFYHGTGTISFEVKSDSISVPLHLIVSPIILGPVTADA